jgi:HEAT repeats
MPAEQALSPGSIAVSAVCRQLHRAYHDVRFYPPGHPTVQQTLDSLTEMLISYVDEHGSLVLAVTEDRLLHEGESVYSYEAGHDNLAFLMFRDGVRTLSLHRGLETGEVEALALCLARADDPTDAEQDLVTRFWEEDFAHIEYYVVNPFQGGDTLREGMVDALRGAVIRRLEEASLGSTTVHGIAAGDLTVVEQTVFDWGTLALSAAELEQCDWMSQDPSDALQEFTIVLLEIAAGSSGQAADFDSLTRSLAMVVDSHMRSRNMEGLTLVFGRLARLEAECRGPTGLFDSVAETGVTTEGLARFLAGIGQMPAEEAARIEGFLSAQRSRIYPALLELLAETDDRAMRRSVLALLGSEDGVPLSELIPFLQDPRWYVVRNAVQLAAGSPDSSLPGQLERLLRHPDVRVRREVMRTLDTLSSGPALDVLAKALGDGDSSVRTLAVGSLGRQGSYKHAAVVLAHVEGPDFDARPAEEAEAFLLALAALARDQAVPVLDRLWRRKLFRARPAPIRLAAIQAVATIPGPAARSVLKDAARSGDAQVKKVAAHALHKPQTGGSWSSQ